MNIDPTKVNTQKYLIILSENETKNFPKCSILFYVNNVI